MFFLFSKTIKPHVQQLVVSSITLIYGCCLFCDSIVITGHQPYF